MRKASRHIDKKAFGLALLVTLLQIITIPLASSQGVGQTVSTGNSLHAAQYYEEVLSDEEGYKELCLELLYHWENASIHAIENHHCHLLGSPFQAWLNNKLRDRLVQSRSYSKHFHEQQEQKVERILGPMALSPQEKNKVKQLMLHLEGVLTLRAPMSHQDSLLLEYPFDEKMRYLAPNIMIDIW